MKYTETAELMGLSFDAVTMETAVARCLDLCGTPRTSHTVITVNASHLCTMRRDPDAISQWLERELGRFGGDLGRAAEFSMRFTAIRLGLLSGPSDPTIEQVLDVGLWRDSGTV